MKYTFYLKNILSHLLYYSGFIKMCSIFDNNSIILGYHHILPDKDDRITFFQPGMYVTTKTFEDHLTYLSNRYNIIPLETLIKYPDIKNACIITLDDGWSDNYTYAYPILKKYKTPATIFISTNMIGSMQWPWPDRLCYYLKFSSDDQVSAALKIICSYLPANTIIKKNISAIENKLLISDYLISHIKNLDNDKINYLMNRIDAHMKLTVNSTKVQRPWLNWDEICEMSRNNISFGAHAHNHTILTKTSRHNARKEIFTSMSVLSEKIGKPITLFSFPNGDYNEHVITMLKEYGFKIGVTVQSGTINKSKSLLSLKRIMIHNDITYNIPLFSCRISNSIPLF